MRIILFFFTFVFFFIGATGAHAQSSCLKHPSNSAAPANYGASWDVTSTLKELLIKSNCPTSGNSLNITVGKGNTAQYIWSTMYVYSGSNWTDYTLAGTSGGAGWLIGQGDKTITMPFTPTPANPLYFVGYVCTPSGSSWKCGCANASCTTKYWQLQGYLGIGGGTTGGTTGGGEGAACLTEGSCVQNATPADLQDKLDAASCGCTIRLAGGTYSGSYTYAKNCPKSNPVVLKGAPGFTSNFGGRITLSGNGLTIMAASFLDGAKIMVNGDNNRVTRNKFIDTSTNRGAIELKGAENNEIDRNSFSGNRFIFLGAFVNKTADEVKNTHVHHNYFTALGNDTTENIPLYIGLYAAELHWDIMHEHANNLATIEYNMFENMRVRNTIHIKSNRNTVQYNYVKNAATIDVRQGQHNIIKGNYVQNGYLGTHEEFNQFLCNRITGGSIDIFAGEGGLTQFGLYQSGTAKDTLVSGNNGKLVLGDMWGLGGHTEPDEPALRTEVRGHTGEIVERFHQNSTINVGATPVCTAPTAPPVVRANVGIEAPCN